jgi:PAS domain S-box-containing protein
MLRESDLFELLHEAADACFVSGPDGLIRDWNPAAEVLFGIPAADAISKPCAAILQGRDADAALVCTADCPVLQLAQENQPIHSFDMEVTTASGVRRWINVSILVATLADREKLLIHLCGDLNSRKRIEQVTLQFLAQLGTLTERQVEDLISPVPPPHSTLTKQERQVLQLIALGRNSKEIALELNISTATARNHTQRVLQKLGVHSRTEAVHRASREHLI